MEENRGRSITARGRIEHSGEILATARAVMIPIRNDENALASIRTGSFSEKSLLIPGIGGTADCWNPLFTGRLQSCLTVDKVELPGAGETIGQMAEGLSLSPPPDIVIGFSIGAAVVQEMLVSPSSRVSMAVLMAPPAGNVPRAAEERHDFSDGRGRWSASMLEMMFTPAWLAAHPDVTEFFPRVKRSIPGIS